MNTIPLDIPSFNTQIHEEFMWPTVYDSYTFLSNTLVDTALEVLSSQKGEVEVALTCKLSDILIDVGHAVRQAIDLRAINNANLEIEYNAEYSPTIDFLLGKSESVIRHSRSTSLSTYVRYAKRVINNSLTPPADGYHSISHNGLMKENIKTNSINTINTLTELYFSGKPKLNVHACKDIATALHDVVANTISLKYPIAKAINQIVKYHIEQALGDIDHIKSSNLSKKLGKGIISGTPKYEGRLLGWYFLDNGKEVIRHAHGGERVFYKDYIWPIAELPYCSSYFAHSKVEAQSLKKRIYDGNYASMPMMKSITFDSLGSDKHKNIYKDSVKPTDNKTIVYVAGVYLGDLAPNFPTFKAPDSQYFDFQIRLLRFLKDEGWRVIVKPHPKGLYSPAELLKDYADEIVTEYYDPNMFNAETFLFDFAGTAFFDTLASKQRITLLNIGNRPFDKEQQKELEKRCSINNCGFDTKGRIELDKNKVLQAIKKAPKGEFNNFVKRYVN